MRLRSAPGLQRRSSGSVVATELERGAGARMSDIALDELAARLGELAILDVRTSSEYDGSLGAPCDPRQGHIPGAAHLDLQEMMLLGRDELRARLGLADGARWSSTATAAPARAWPPRSWPGSDSRRGTTRAPGTSGRAASFRSRPIAERDGLRCGFSPARRGSGDRYRGGVEQPLQERRARRRLGGAVGRVVVVEERVGRLRARRRARAAARPTRRARSAV